MNSRDPSVSDVESAIERVLAAESAARLAVDESVAEARALLDSARAQSRRIAERAGARLQRLSQRIDAACARDVEALDGMPLAAASASASDPARMRQLVDAVAAELTGGSP